MHLDVSARCLFLLKRVLAHCFWFVSRRIKVAQTGLLKKAALLPCVAHRAVSGKLTHRSDAQSNAVEMNLSFSSEFKLAKNKEKERILFLSQIFKCVLYILSACFHL